MFRTSSILRLYRNNAYKARIFTLIHQAEMTHQSPEATSSSQSTQLRGSKPTFALVLMGGGARTAYQVGVLNIVARLLKEKNTSNKTAINTTMDTAKNHYQPKQNIQFPFQILVGTSAGALNTSCLAGFACEGLSAFEKLHQFWQQLRSHHVYELNISPWIKASRVLAAISLSLHARRYGALLNNMPLVDTLHRTISLKGIDLALDQGILQSVAVTASSYTTGVHWTFCHAHPKNPSFQPWSRPGRKAEFQPLTIEHLIASSAIPFMFAPTALWANGRREFFGDGSMRHHAPLSPALHLGANRILVIGVGQPERSLFVDSSNMDLSSRPSLGAIAGHAMASVFQDALQADVEQLERINQVILNHPNCLDDSDFSLSQNHLSNLNHLNEFNQSALNHFREKSPSFRLVQTLAIQPSQSLDELAQMHSDELPKATRNTLAGLGALHGTGAALASYLLFEPRFIQALINLGERDALMRQKELLDFLGESE